MSLYSLLEFLHVASAIVWVGGVAALALIGLRVARDGDGADLATLARQSGFYGRSVLGPAAFVTLVAGLATAAVGGLDLRSPWLAWGFVGVFGSMLLGGWAIRRAGERLAERADRAPVDDPRVAAARRRVTSLNALNLLLLLSVVAAMVMKPTL